MSYLVGLCVVWCFCGAVCMWCGPYVVCRSVVVIVVDVVLDS